MPPAARMGDMVLQDIPHCHTLHPATPPVPIPHPALPLTIVGNAVMNVTVGGAPAAVMGSTTTPCTLPGCVPNGPGVIMKGSATVMIGNRPAGRVGDMTNHAACVAPIPSPIGKILPPGAPTVMIGG